MWIRMVPQISVASSFGFPWLFIYPFWYLYVTPAFILFEGHLVIILIGVEVLKILLSRVTTHGWD